MIGCTEAALKLANRCTLHSLANKASGEPYRCAAIFTHNSSFHLELKDRQRQPHPFDHVQRTWVSRCDQKLLGRALQPDS